MRTNIKYRILHFLEYNLNEWKIKISRATLKWSGYVLKAEKLMKIKETLCSEQSINACGLKQDGAGRYLQ